ncbi:unnamed protein product [Diatraea saccharalis]|uniref:GH18 domain-containing protein n=1 Tax=Diatraea saccharalis TaxID=40085 RepID=A0A9N9R9Y7_9NEOP|nr:unnamed protein product [Diatraea saccharalis]
MTYDMAETLDKVTVHNAPLHKGEGHDDSVDRNTLFTVDVAVEYWLKSGCPPEKIVLGIPFYGPTFVLSSADENGVGASVTGPGISGPFTLTRGVIGYNEVTFIIRSSFIKLFTLITNSNKFSSHTFFFTVLQQTSYRILDDTKG